jgi:hypothetical protein
VGEIETFLAAKRAQKPVGFLCLYLPICGIVEVLHSYKKRVVSLKKITIFLLITLASCNPDESFTYWTDSTENQIQRLDEAEIRYEIRDGEIWVIEEDLKKVMACCS